MAAISKKITSGGRLQGRLALVFIFSVLMLAALLGLCNDSGAAFDASYITSDITFTDSNSMTEADIQAFLESKGSYLAGYHETRDSQIGPNNDVPAHGWSASKIIWQVAHWYGVNPMVILTTLQKEQSLVTNPAPPEWALDWAMGYGCPDSSPCSSYQGFALQVDWGTWQLRWNMDLANSHDPRVSPYITGNTITIDNTPVYLGNGATASLYRYTPHFQGNENFAYIYESWFGLPLFHPFGSVDSVQGGEGEFRINGWAIDPDTTAPIDVHVYVDGHPVAAMTASSSRPDVGAAYPAYGSSHGFSRTLSAAPGNHTVCAYGINTGYGGNALLGCKAVEVQDDSAKRSPFGSLDSARGVPFGIQAGGWAIDPDTSGAIDVHIYVDGRLAAVATANGDRPDVGAAYPASGPNHGFTATFPASAGSHTVCAYGINVDRGGNALLGCKTAEVPASPSGSSPFGSLDAAEGLPLSLRVSGWAIDPDTGNPIDVHVYVDGRPVAAMTANGSRPDVGAVYPLSGNNHGYDRTISVTGGGSHTVCTYGINVAGGGNALLGCRTAETPSDPTGSVDSVQSESLGLKANGWAIDPDTTGPIDVHFYIDGQPAAAAKADVDRPDVAAAYPAFGSRHGFDKAVSARAGSHTLCAYGINTGGGSNALLECEAGEVPDIPAGNLDSVRGVPYGLLAGGWAIDPDTSDPIDVHLYVDGAPVAALTADRERTDVGAVYPVFGTHHGFEKALIAPAGSHTLCAYGINVAGGGNALLGCRTATVPVSSSGNNPFGNLDAAQASPDGIHVSGWAIDPDSSDPIDVHIWVDGQPAAALAADGNRPDVGAAYPVFGDMHGFDGNIPASEGSHTVCVYGINQGPGGNALLGCGTVDLAINPFGNLDGASEGDPGRIDVSGWAIDPGTTGPIDVHIYVNGQPAGVLTANGSRPDVGAVWPAYGAGHGFSGNVAGSPGSTVCAYGINVGAGGNALLGCKVMPQTATVTVTADSAFNVTDGNGATLASLGAGQIATIAYAPGIYYVQAPGVSVSSGSYIILAPAGGDGIMQVTSYHDISSWDPGIDDNRFRGKIEVRYSPVSDRLWVINELPLELYLRGIAETSSGAPGEFLKTMSIAARDYALYHVNRGGKYYENGQDIFHLKNSRNGNGDDQVYKGYGLESRFPDLTAAVTATNGLVVTYNGSLALATYFSNSDGRTRSAQEAWGVTYWPWLASVPDPDCNGMTLNGHGVGLSGHGAYKRAERGESYNDILTYYYQGTTVQPMDTNKDIRVAIYSPD